MLKNILIKCFVVGIIILFIGTNIVPGISKNTIKNIDDSQDYEFVPGEFIVKLAKNEKISSPSIKTLNEKYSVYSITSVFKNSDNLNFYNIYKFKVPKEAEIISIVNDYSSSLDVEYAEPNYLFFLTGIPNDEKFSNQWGLYNTGQNGGTQGLDIDAIKAWDIETGGSDITIAVIDSGIDYTHPDLANNIWVNNYEIPNNGIDDDNNGYIDDVNGWDFHNNINDPLDYYGHGTHCSGIASAVTNNGVGVAGVCWNCKIMPVKGFGGMAGSLDDLVNCIYYASDNGADVISMSWGGHTSSDLLRDTIDYAYSNGVVLVSAAGNDNSDRMHYPAAFDNVISVAATNNNDTRAWFSNYGEWVDIAAPGKDIYSTMPTYDVELNFMPYYLSKNYDYLEGTSMACPMVAGLAALILSYNPDLTPDEVGKIIHDSSDWIFTDQYIGNGRINSYKALLIASGVTNPPYKPDAPLGQTNGQPGIEYDYTTTTTDPDNDDLYYLFSWGDGTYSDWIGPFSSGTIVTSNHLWNSMGFYEIKTKGKDSYGVESNWSDPLTVSMPRIKAINTPYLNYLQSYPNLFHLLQKIIQRI